MRKQTVRTACTMVSEPRHSSIVVIEREEPVIDTDLISAIHRLQRECPELFHRSSGHRSRCIQRS